MNILEGFKLYEGNSDKTVWKDCKPSPSHFSPITGDKTFYQVHLAYSSALEREEVIDVVHQTISRALSFAQENVQEDTYAIRISWFATYSTMTITYGSEDKDSIHVVKCCFEEMDSSIWGGIETFLEAEEGGKETTTIRDEASLYDCYLDMIQAGITNAIENPIINKVLLRLREMNIGLYYYKEEDYENAKRIF
ncbi:MAG: hypothetical protein EAZ95_15465 [Bacteroidetes bacterium]|nr:MAG: hypothetical protein EAZ95_15465 [Bacteroidota bacterium]